MLEIDVDIRRLATLFRDEALEQQVVTIRIDRRHAKHVTDRAVRRGAPALTENPF
jgi:hypothetical protein